MVRCYEPPPPPVRLFNVYVPAYERVCKRNRTCCDRTTNDRSVSIERPPDTIRSGIFIVKKKSRTLTPWRQRGENDTQSRLEAHVAGTELHVVIGQTANSPCAADVSTDWNRAVENAVATERCRPRVGQDDNRWREWKRPSECEKRRNDQNRYTAWQSNERRSTPWWQRPVMATTTNALAWSCLVAVENHRQPRRRCYHGRC